MLIFIGREVFNCGFKDNAKVNAEIERRWLDFGSDALTAEHQQATEKQDKRREVSNDRLPNDMN